MPAVAIDLGTSPAPPSHASPAPPATRTRTPGWRDPRLWVGVVVVAGSVLLGARVVGAADDTVTVWAAAEELPAGAPLRPDDLVAARVRFADEADLAAYLPTSQELPADAVLGRSVGAGELVPGAALGAGGDSDLLQLAVAVEPEQLARAVAAGSRRITRSPKTASNGVRAASSIGNRNQCRTDRRTRHSGASGAFHHELRPAMNDWC